MKEPDFIAFESVADAIVVVSRDGSIAYANEYAARLFGYSQAELAGLPLEALLPEKYREGHEKLRQGFFRDPTFRPMGAGQELRALRRDSEEFPAEIAIGPLAGSEHAVAVVRDVSATAQVKDELRESELRFRIASSQTADVLQHVNVASDSYTWFGDIDGLLGYDPSEFPRTFTGWLEQIHPDDIARIEAEIERIVDNGEPGWNFRYRMRAKDGSYRHWLDRGTVTAFVDGRANEGIGAIVDETNEIEARQALEEALKETSEHAAFSQSVLSALDGHLAVLNQEGDIIAVNGAWQAFAKDNDAESQATVAVGANYLEACRLAGTPDALQARDGARSVLDRSKARFNMEYACHSPTEKRWFSMTVTPMQTDGAIVVHTNVTPLLEAQTELEKAVREVSRLKERSEAEGQYLRAEIRSSHNFEEIVGNSSALLATLDQLDRVAETNATVLLLGETGTGKELLARATHARSKRSKRPLIRVDCTTLPPGLIESELFGHEKGAFTGAHDSKAGRFELADGGTIFLDEVGELPLELQVKLLRAIQDGEIERLGGKGVKKIDVRVIAATNRNLRDEVRAGRFRADLYYRLSVFPVEIPPLRDRREDISALASYFLKHRGKSLGTQVDQIPRTTMDVLMAYDWPGNIRELQNVLERAMILARGRDLIITDALEPAERQPRESGGVLRKDLDQIERKQILGALDASDWRIKGDGNAADRLGLKPSTLRSRMKRLGIERRSEGSGGIARRSH